MMNRFRLAAPDFVSGAGYWRSCRAGLFLTTCLGLQAILVLMVGIGPIPVLPHDPDTLTAAGRFFLAVEYDTEAYAAGCFLTLAMGCLWLWAWNGLLWRTGPAAAEALSVRGSLLWVAVAFFDLMVFAFVLGSLAPDLVESRRVSPARLSLLATPGLLALVAAGVGTLLMARRARSEAR